jgi:hypothetical protein
MEEKQSAQLEHIRDGRTQSGKTILLRNQNKSIADPQNCDRSARIEA